jgi:hypothetical protein
MAEKPDDKYYHRVLPVAFCRLPFNVGVVYRPDNESDVSKQGSSPVI